MDPRTHAAVTWLLNCDEPAIRLMTRLYAAGERFLSRSSAVCITEGFEALETWVCPAGRDPARPGIRSCLEQAV
jgi:hypothetical protein